MTPRLSWGPVAQPVHFVHGLVAVTAMCTAGKILRCHRIRLLRPARARSARAVQRVPKTDEVSRLLWNGNNLLQNFFELTNTHRIVKIILRTIDSHPL